MHASCPIHLHIICDKDARLYLETRLDLVKHPMYDIKVSFYELTLQSLVDRLDREGTMTSVHSAGSGSLCLSKQGRIMMSAHASFQLALSNF